MKDIPYLALTGGYGVSIGSILQVNIARVYYWQRIVYCIWWYEGVYNWIASQNLILRFDCELLLIFVMTQVNRHSGIGNRVEMNHISAT